MTEFLDTMGYAGNTVSGSLVELADVFVDDPKMFVLNPVMGGQLRMDMIGKLKQICPDAPLVLIADPILKSEILDSPQVRQANFIFLQPLDFDRIREALSKI